MGCEHCLNEIKEGEIILAKNENDNNYLNNLESQDKILLSDKKNENTENNEVFSKKLMNIQKDKFNLEVLEEINKFRLIHGVKELILDENINKISQKYAEKLARESELELSGNKYNEKELGEIVFSFQDEISPKELVDIWYNKGSENYDYKKEPDKSSNFTQLIWNNSKYFGIGHCVTKENKIYIVANFYPEGNIKGQFLKNVFPKINENDSSFYSFTTKLFEEIIISHNELRAKHNSPPLVLNPALSTIAQNHSKFLAKEGKKIYSNNTFNNQKLGENIYISNKKCEGEEITSYWYRGFKKYNFKKSKNNENNDDEEEINNFTQLIWKNTKEVGFGFSNDIKGNYYYVANYFPCGNIKGQYQNNVLPE